MLCRLGGRRAAQHGPVARLPTGHGPEALARGQRVRRPARLSLPDRGGVPPLRHGEQPRIGAPDRGHRFPRRGGSSVSFVQSLVELFFFSVHFTLRRAVGRVERTRRRSDASTALEARR